MPIAALVAPTPNSYRRLRPQSWAGAYRCWGLDNREAAVRVPGSGPGKGSSHFELKTVDASSNPYLALGAVVAAGMDGVRRNLDPGPPLQVDPGTLSDAERARRKLEPLPASLDEALARLEADRGLLHALGPGLATAYVTSARKNLDAAALAAQPEAGDLFAFEAQVAGLPVTPAKIAGLGASA